MMESKQAILEAIRRQGAPQAFLPELDRDWIRYDDPRQQFACLLESVGGRCLIVHDVKEMNRELESTPFYQQAKQICSLVPGVAGNVNLATISDAHDLETLDFAILPGKFAVAENGAVWVTDADVSHRAVYFITQHLVLVVPSREIVDNMHQAYERLAFTGRGFGLFVSGPSKTADIEQSLVIGAHGARSLTVFLVNEAQC